MKHRLLKHLHFKLSLNNLLRITTKLVVRYKASLTGNDRHVACFLKILTIINSDSIHKYVYYGSCDSKVILN